MPRRYADDEDEFDDFGGYGDDGEAETVPCPHCGADVYEDAERCPACGKYLTGEDAPPTRPKGWVAVVMVLALIAAVMWVFG